MIFSDYFILDNGQLSLDFIDIPLDTDLCLFIDPTAIRSLRSNWGWELGDLLREYFSKILEMIKSGNDKEALYLLSSLRETNSFHLGYSSGKSEGKALGDKSAEDILISLKGSGAAKTGLLIDLEDTALTIKGVANDRISDSVCNILKEFFIEYTQSVSIFYGVELNESEGIRIWDRTNEKWIVKKVMLPISEYGSVILIPKILARSSIAYSHDSFYRKYIVPSLKNEHLSINSALVDVLKSGKRRVTTKRLLDEYGASKPFIESQVVKYPSSLKEYREEMTLNPPPPLSHKDFQEITKIESAGLLDLTNNVLDLVIGNDRDKYIYLIKKIIPVVFYPSLVYPVVINKDADLYRLSYLNESKKGFFFNLFIFGISCERVVFNFSNDVFSDMFLDTIINDLNNYNLQVAVVFCRKFDGQYNNKLKELSKTKGKYLLVIDDDGFYQLVDEYLKGGDQSFNYINELFKKLND
ncbi:hypothetical protein [Pectobacterium versatile]|uniref:hypothetical protein n=1 Tax=Pectobacterium versatile TaxID=2488639 RepID=UPI001F1867CB|nr:hypothetical protein [Pectobacterium versatile]